MQTLGAEALEFRRKVDGVELGVGQRREDLLVGRRHQSGRRDVALLGHPEGADHDGSLRVRGLLRSHNRFGAEQTDARQKEDVCNRLLVFVRSSEAGGARAVQEEAITAALRQQGGRDCGVQVVANLPFNENRRETSKGTSRFGLSP